MLQESLFLSIIAFGTLAFGCVEPWSLGILYSLICGLAISVIRSSNLRNPFQNSSVAALIPALAVVAILATIQWSNAHVPTHPSAIFPSTQSAYATSHSITRLFFISLFFLSAPTVLQRPGSGKRLLSTLFFLGAFVAFVGVLQQAQGNSSYYGIRKVGPNIYPFGPFINRNHAADLLIFSMLAGTTLLIERWRRLQHTRTTGNRADQSAVLMLFVLLLIVSAWGFAAADSRGALHALIAAAGLIGIARIAQGIGSTKTIIALIALAGVYATVLFIQPNLFGRTTDGLDISTTMRLSIYRSAWQAFLDMPVFGIGLGASRNIFSLYQESSLYGHVYHVHSDWLKLLLETGITGFLITALSLMALFLKLLHADNEANKKYAISHTLLTAAAAAFVIHGIIESNFHTPSNVLIFVAVIAWLGSHGRENTRAYNFRPRYSFALATILLGATSYSLRPALAQWILSHAGNSGDPFRPYFLSRALHADASPWTRYWLGTSFANLARIHPSARPTLLRQALPNADAALTAIPGNPIFLRFTSYVLKKLKRADDAAMISERALPR